MRCGTGEVRSFWLIAAIAAATAVSGCGSTNAGTLASTSSPSRSATPTPSLCTPGSRPPARMGAAMAYDATTKKTVLFSGIRGDGSPPLADTWTWDGCRWAQAKPATSPPGRSFGALTFDASTGKLVLFGGGAANSDPARND